MLVKGDVVASIEDETYEIEVERSVSRVRFLSQKIAHLERKLKASSELLETSAISEIQVDDIRIDLVGSSVEYELELLTLRKNRLQLRKTTIYAPISGVVVERHARSGELMQAGNSVARIVDVNNIYIESSVPAIDAIEIQEGDSVLVHASNGIVCGIVDRQIPMALSANNVRVWTKVDGISITIGASVRVSFRDI